MHIPFELDEQMNIGLYFHAMHCVNNLHSVSYLTFLIKGSIIVIVLCP